MTALDWATKLDFTNANIVINGNSISAWTDNTATGKWTDRLKLIAPFSNAGCSITNVAIPGRSTAVLTAEAIAVVDPLYVPGKLNISIIWEGTNDIGGPTGTGEAMGVRMRGYCLDRRRRGWKNIAFGLQGARVAAGGASSQADYDRCRLGFNAWMRDNHRSFCEAYVDPSVDQKLNNALVADIPDGIHPSSVTLNGILPLVTSALLSLVP
jgi:lysophospholipase L1-like esterase